MNTTNPIIIAHLGNDYKSFERAIGASVIIISCYLASSAEHCIIHKCFPSGPPRTCKAFLFLHKVVDSRCLRGRHENYLKKKKKKTFVAVPLRWFLSGSCPSKHSNLFRLLPGLLLLLSGPFAVAPSLFALTDLPGDTAAATAEEVGVFSEIRKAIGRWDGIFYFTNNRYGTFTRG